jgi:hypothetical protein
MKYNPPAHGAACMSSVRNVPCKCLADLWLKEVYIWHHQVFVGKEVFSAFIPRLDLIMALGKPQAGSDT